MTQSTSWIKTSSRVVVMGILLLASATQTAMAQPTILQVQAHQTKNSEQIAFYVDEVIDHQDVFLLSNPTRIVVDLDKVNGAAVKMPANYKGHLISAIRFGSFDSDTSRIVVDLNQRFLNASLHHFEAKNGQPYRLVLEMELDPKQMPKTAAATPQKEKHIAFIAPEDAARANSSVPIPKFKPAVPPTMGEASVAPSRGYKPLVAVDAGHGGKDPGATSAGGTREKNVTLAVAKDLMKRLKNSGRYRVMLTRNTDKFIKLRKRVELARDAGADVFVSLHADSASVSKARGLSVYTVSENASDKESAILAKKENAADDIVGIDTQHDDKYVSDILIDLAQRDTKNKSSSLADMMVKQFKAQKIKLPSTAHRFAGFRVLKAPDVPSVLVEMGFLTNKTDERLLKTRDYRDKITRSIQSSLDKFFKSHAPRGNQ